MDSGQTASSSARREQLLIAARNMSGTGRRAIPLVSPARARGLGSRLGWRIAVPAADSIGRQAAFAYEAGGGVDINRHVGGLRTGSSAKWSGRAYFGTYQYSPKVSVGVVFKF